ncbi:MAG: hypothetical protein AB6733_05540 [Clostridiaceae bacterium]
MDEKAIMKVADILSINTYKVDALTKLLVEKNLLTKDEINNAISSVMDEAKEDPNTDEYVIESLKEKVLL